MPPPERWEDYCGVKNVIEGTRLVCFKVPLKNALQSKIEDDKKFSPEILIEKLKENSSGLGMVIDLTFTKKYYNLTEFTNKGIQYEKIFTKGKEVPSDYVFGKFAHAVDGFLETNKDNKLLIGIHCTHGVNRTGYLVCRYMIERYSWEPDVAISNFNESRGHSLERENYIEDLKTRKPKSRSILKLCYLDMNWFKTLRAYRVGICLLIGALPCALLIDWMQKKRAQYMIP